MKIYISCVSSIPTLNFMWIYYWNKILIFHTYVNEYKYNIIQYYYVYAYEYIYLGKISKIYIIYIFNLKKMGFLVVIF